MSISERDAVLRERAAFEEGCKAVFRHKEGINSWAGSFPLATARYPLPKVTRPRVWTDTNGRDFRYADGQLQTRDPDIEESWHCLASGTRYAGTSELGLHITPERIRQWADLMSNPTEEIEAEP